MRLFNRSAVRQPLIPEAGLSAAIALRNPSPSELRPESASAGKPAEAPRDRFIGFAFAAADLLIEIGPDRRIRFAAGSFYERFQKEADTYIGRPVFSIVDAEDHGGLEVALSMLATRGRLAPVAVRLANSMRTCVAMSGLSLPDNNGVAWLTVARMPAAVSDPPVLAAGPVLKRVMDFRLREEQRVDLGLIEVSEWARIGGAKRQELEASIGEALRQAGGEGALAAELAEGRFGVLSQQGMDVAELEARVVQILRRAGSSNAVGGASIAVEPGAIPQIDAVRAMRFALSSFVSGGTKGVAKAGFDQGLRGFLDRTETHALAMGAAIESARFKLAFQPVVSLATRQVHHYEALLRPFPIEGLSLTGPEDFVAFAEAMGLVEALDTAVLTQAAEAIRGSKAAIAINVSGVSMQNIRFRQNLMEQIMKDASLHERLIVELTETADIDDMGAAAETMQGLGNAGIPVCLDDFGAGFASFRYLRDFRVSYVKIDGSYVRQMLNGARECGFVGSMVDLARSVGAETIAESIETEAQATACVDQGVLFGQGWLFGRPGSLPGAL